MESKLQVLEQRSAPRATAADGPPLVPLLEMMVRIREFEAFCMDLRSRGEVLGNTFPCLGQEAFCAVGAALSPQDVIFPSYRSRGVFFGKGVDVAEHLRELVASPRSQLAGREVFHHASWPSAGLMPGSSMIGGWMPMAAGYALSTRLKGMHDVATVCTWGDGSYGAGDFHEALNLIGVWKLPVVLVCENNGYQVSAGWQSMRTHRQFRPVMDAYGIATLDVDGNDAQALWEATVQARRMALDGRPVLIDAVTYRMGGYSSHIGEPRHGHEQEMAAWRERDPVALLARRIAAGEAAAQQLLEQVRAEQRRRVQQAWDGVRSETAAEEVAR